MEETYKEPVGKVMKCPFCGPHDFQDQVYGKGRRVHTPTLKYSGKGDTGKRGWRCTVCGEVNYQ